MRGDCAALTRDRVYKGEMWARGYAINRIKFGEREKAVARVCTRLATRTFGIW